MQEAIRTLTRNIKRFRAQRGLSLSALAREAQLSKSTLSKIERGEANPSMDTLWSLAGALRVPFATLFVDDGEHPMIEVLRRGQAPRVARDGAGAFIARDSKHDPHFVVRHMLSRHARGELEVYSVDIEPRVEQQAAPHSRGVIEHVYAVAGRVEVRVDDFVEELSRGDRMSFLADRPHVYRALGKNRARVVVLLDYP
jgi:XRE family transcriptional regulator, regulator of sulfur utilization